VSRATTLTELSEAGLREWLEQYKAAWEQKDPEQAAALFTADATYQETPYADPFRGRDAIRTYWAGVTSDQSGIDFAFDPISVSGQTGVAQWSARFRSISADVAVELNGIFVLMFAAGRQVSSLREWWHAR